jgi:hypothetical protein
MQDQPQQARDWIASLRKDDPMKRTIWMTIGALLLAGVNLASAQALGDVARSNRKGKVQQVAAHHYDNDNLPTTDKLSVVGPAPASTPSNAAATTSAQPPADPKAAAAERQLAADEWKNKIDDQKKSIDALNHELDLTQREYRLRAVAQYSDAGNRLRNSAQWDKDDADFKKQLEEKQKEVDTAKHDLENLQEQARKAGVKERE